MKKIFITRPITTIIIAIGIILTAGILVVGYLNSGSVTPVAVDDAYSDAVDAQYLVSFASDVSTSPEIPAISIRVDFPAGYSISSPVICNHDCSVDDKLTINGTDTTVFNVTAVDSDSIQFGIGPWSLSGTIEFIVKSGVTNPNATGPTGTFTISVLNSSGGAVLDSESGISGVTITVPPNNPPTDIVLTMQTFAANQAIGTTIATIASLDADLGDTHTYALNCITPAGPGADDDHFTISGGSLVSATVFNYDTPQDADGDNVYEICITSYDGLSTYQEEMTITVTAPVNHAPTGINFSLSPSEFEEGQVIGTTIGTVDAVDSDAVDTHTYGLTCTIPGDDDEHFTVVGDSVKSATVFDFSAPQDSNGDNVYYFCVRATDSGSLTYDNTIMLTITEAVGGGGGGPIPNNEPGVESLGPINLTNGGEITDTTPTFTFTITDSDVADQIYYAFYLLDDPALTPESVVADYQSPLGSQGAKTLTIGSIPDEDGTFNFVDWRTIEELSPGIYYWLVVPYDQEGLSGDGSLGWDNGDPEAYSFKVVEAAAEEPASEPTRSGSPATVSLGSIQIAAPANLTISPTVPQLPFIIPKELIVINIPPNPPVDVFNVPRMPQLYTAGDQVKSIQKFLNDHGFPVNDTNAPGGPGKETIFFGPKTRAAVVAFQKANNLVPDGIVGPKTWAVIQKILTEKNTQLR